VDRAAGKLDETNRIAAGLTALDLPDDAAAAA
jgi:hypothetical protein